MIRKVWMIVCAAALFAGLVGCGTPVTDAKLLNINPSVVRVNVGNVTTIQIFLTKARANDGTVQIFIDNDEFIKPATSTGEITVSKGQDMVSFDLQGIKAGSTTLRARIGDDPAISAPVIVSNQ